MLFDAILVRVVHVLFPLDKGLTDMLFRTTLVVPPHHSVNIVT